MMTRVHFDVLFATVDDSILCFDLELRRSVQASLIEVMHTSKIDNVSTQGNNRISGVLGWCHEREPIAGPSV
jgi:hypothetical protein